MALQEECAKAIGLLNALEDKDGSLSRVKGTAQPPLRKTVRSSKALLFQWSYKGGAVIGADVTNGFVLMHLGSGQWSAPLFVSSTSLSVGFTVGFSEISALVGLLTQNAADKFKQQSQVVVNADFSLAIFPADIKSGVSDDLLAGVGDAISFAVGKGVLADWSLKGGRLAADAKKNSLVYGEDLPAETILSGSVPAPEAFTSLYEALKAYDQANP